MLKPLIPLILAGFIGFGVWVFRRLPGPYAVLLIVIGGQLFLPEVQVAARTAETPAAITLPLIKLAKTHVIAYALLAGSLWCDKRRWREVYLRWYDLPMVVWCLAPLLASWDNDLGLYDGYSEFMQQTIAWGVPYWMGRLYLGSRDGLRAWCAAVIVGAVVYVPLCLIEMRFSPQLHNWVYGFHAADFVHTARDGGYRPSGFLEQGLALALYLSVATVCAFWLWTRDTFRAFVVRPDWPHVSLGLMVIALVGTLAFAHSLGAQLLAVLGASVLVICLVARSALPLWVLVAFPPCYIAVRYSAEWKPQAVVAWVRENVSVKRAESLDIRLTNEQVLVDKAQERPLFGWGGWNRSRVRDEFGRDKSLTDSLWIVSLGATGLFGLGAMVITGLLPPARLIWHCPPKAWRTPAEGPAAAVAVALLMVVLDQLANAQLNGAYMVALGAAGGAATSLRPRNVNVGRARVSRQLVEV
ncbi:MAG: hypothetical protein U0746_09285 [Gemmataceae bacterium]